MVPCTKLRISMGVIFALKYVRKTEGYQDVGLEELNEIDILSRVHHPHIIHATQILTRRNCQISNLAIVLPLADDTLSGFTAVSRIRNTTTEDKLPILYKLATALEFLHQANILYLDIKTTNVVLRGDHPYFIDFGTSRVVPDINTGFISTQQLVTINYRAPELFNKIIIYTATADIWSFGIMMLHVLSGGSLMQVFSKILTYSIRIN